MDRLAMYRAALRNELYYFMAKAFEILEPSNPFEWNWHLECIAEHLTASFNGELPRLIINIPPRCLKSVTVAQIYPAWVLGKEPHHQFIGASYAHSLAERNVSACRRLVKDDFYKMLFPETEIEVSRQDFFTTTKAGQYKGTGIGGTITGYGCFVGDTEIVTNKGLMKIKDIKAGNTCTHCLSYNHKNDILEWKKVEADRVLSSGDIYKVTTSSGKAIKCTGDHRFYVKGKGYIEAQNLQAGEILVKANAGKARRFDKGWESLRSLWSCRGANKSKFSKTTVANEFTSSSHRHEPCKQSSRQSSDAMQFLPHYTSQEDTVVMVERLRDGIHQVYDIQVADNHNFFANGILVHNCNTLLIDDPQNPKEGNSPTVRNTTNQEIRQTLFSRFNDKRTGKLIMIMQRLHDDDATGNLARDGGYHVLKLPAETKTQIQISLHGKQWLMESDSLLSPRLPREALDELRIDLQENGYAGQYLQEPIPVGGGEFKTEWLQFYDPKTKKNYGNIYILCDAAGGDEMNKKKKKTSDWTAFMVVELASDNNYYLLDIVRDRLNPTERVETLFMLHRKWNALSGKPPKVGYEKYGMMTDTHYIKIKQNEENYRFNIIELGGQMMKEERIRRIIPDMQRGFWYFPFELIYIDNEGRRFDLVKELIEGEMPTFPKARFDDMLDALSRIKDAEMMATFPKLIKTLHESSKPAESWMDW